MQCCVYNYKRQKKYTDHETQLFTDRKSNNQFKLDLLLNIVCFYLQYERELKNKEDLAIILYNNILLDNICEISGESFEDHYYKSYRQDIS